MVMAKNDFPESTGFTHPFLGYPISSHPQVVKIEDADGLFKDISRGHLQRQECIPPPFQARLITPSVVSERLKVNGSVARQAIRHLEDWAGAVAMGPRGTR